MSINNQLIDIAMFRYEKSRKPLKTKAFGVVSWRRKRDLNPRPHA